MFVPFGGTQHGSCKVTETSVTEFAIEVKHCCSRDLTH